MPKVDICSCELVFSPMQRRARDLLRKRDRPTLRLSEIYRGALSALTSERPERLAQCAHSCREILRLLPELLGIGREKGTSLQSKVYTLRENWLHFKKENEPFGGASSGPSPRGVDSFLRQTNAFFEWFSSQGASRRELYRKVVKHLDPLARDLGAEKVDEWMRLQDKFNKIAKHNVAVAQSEMRNLMSSFTRFLISLLEDRVFADFDAIDQILGKAR